VRLLIANHIDDSIRTVSDQRAWTQRILWFAGNDDVVILSTDVDERFLRYVTGLTGVDSSTLRLHVLPPGRFGSGLWDHQMLSNPHFIQRVRQDLGNVEGVFALWPSPHVAQFAIDLGVEKAYAGVDFFLQYGAELANSKANFRAIAASLGIGISRGAVCRTDWEMRHALEAILSERTSAMIKQIHNAAGSGNHLVTMDSSLTSGHAGSSALLVVDGEDGIEELIGSQWKWASQNGKFAFIVEEFVDRAETVYAEYLLTDAEVQLNGTGGLVYDGGRLAQEIAPLDVERMGRAHFDRLVEQSAKLAQAYWQLGYRGYLGIDAVWDRRNVTFTEANARVSGSLHIYDAIGKGVVGTVCASDRVLTQYYAPRKWVVDDHDHFCRVLADTGSAYDRTTRLGVIACVSIDLTLAGAGRPIFCIVHDSESTRASIFSKLDAAFSRNTHDALTQSSSLHAE
jgi:hypothetical protein